MFVNEYRGRCGVEPICRAVQLAPSTYWSAKRPPRSVHSLRDEEMKTEVSRVHRENSGMYGAPKIWAQFNRDEIDHIKGIRTLIPDEPKSGGQAKGPLRHIMACYGEGLEFISPYSRVDRC